MKRNVIQLAGKTLVVSLPSKWVKLNSVKKGDELNVLEEGNKITIQSSELKSELKTTEIDIKEMSERAINWSLSALYKKGYDEVNLYYSGDQLNYIQFLLKNSFLGYAIMEQTTKKLVIKSIAQELPDEYKPVLRRAFLVTLSMGKSMLEVLKSKDYKRLREIKEEEKINNQLTNFCQRIINKKLPFKNEINHLNYVISWNLEKIADEYRYICEFFMDKNPRFRDESLVIFEETNNLFERFYNLVYNFDITKLNELSRIKLELELRIRNYIFLTVKEDNYLSLHLLNIVNRCSDFSTSLAAINQPD
ncbi:phosphate uptake regulator PhoU [Candidatus Woesearchaeota archaeon]|nr:phosphate uptake regulator PhoU [Candidatus Woesearchaeota archaeon]